MQQRSPILIAGGAIGLIAVLAVVWYLASPLFIDQTVDEEFPFEIPSAEEIAEMSEEERAQAEEEMLEAGAQMADEMIEDDMPAEGPVPLRSGQFVDIDSVHQGSGMGTIYELPDGNHIVRFEEFNVTNGPQLHVLLATAPAPTTSGELGEYIDLGGLKGNMGNQNYEIPADVDLDQYQSIVIYCMPFHVVFSTATLQ